MERLNQRLATARTALATLNELLPKSVRSARAGLQVGPFDEAHARQVLATVDDRNLTVHTYNEPLAEEINSRLSGHALLLQHWLDQMTARLPE